MNVISGSLLSHLVFIIVNIFIIYSYIYIYNIQYNIINTVKSRKKTRILKKDGKTPTSNKSLGKGI